MEYLFSTAGLAIALAATRLGMIGLLTIMPGKR
jgi:hypothetical protein